MLANASDKTPVCVKHKPNTAGRRAVKFAESRWQSAGGRICVPKGIIENMRIEQGRTMLEPSCRAEVRVPSGAVATACVYASAAVADAPGTPFAVTYEPAPLVIAGMSPRPAANEGLVRGGSVVAIDRVAKPEDVLEVASRLGVTEFLMAGPLREEVRALAPSRVLDALPARRHRPLVTFDQRGACVSLASPGIAVRPATMEDEPAIQAMYDHLLDACDVPGAETCGWKRGYWPLPHDVARRVEEGTTWVAQDEEAAAPGNTVLGAMSLDHDFGLPGVELPLEPLPEKDSLTCHLLAVDPSARGRGVATALLTAYAREGIARGCKVLRINTSPQSLSNRLYRELGFVLHRPVWFPYEGLPLTGWTNVYELRLDAQMVAEKGIR